MPKRSLFGPLHESLQQDDVIVMTVDEYETIRLIDLVGLTQKECAQQMGVARTTVQGIYAGTRKKIAQAIVEGKFLKIEGGEYRLCEGQGLFCGHAGCHRHGHRHGQGRK